MPCCVLNLLVMSLIKLDAIARLHVMLWGQDRPEKLCLLVQRTEFGYRAELGSHIGRSKSTLGRISTEEKR